MTGAEPDLPDNTGHLSASAPVPLSTPKTSTVKPTRKKSQELELEAWQAWRQQPQNPHLTSQMLSTIRPSIDRAVSAHLGPTASDPVMKGRARQMALQAMERYNPDRGTSVSTYLTTQLAGIRRYNRRQTHALRVPERAGLLNAKVLDAEDELTDTLGRPPSEQEISAHLQISPRHLARIRRQTLGERAEGSFLTEEGATWSPAIQSNQRNTLWAELVHGDLTPTNQLILEHTAGLFGKPVLSNQQIAAKLKISPGAVSQRKQLIQSLLDKEDKLSPFGGS